MAVTGYGSERDNLDNEWKCTLLLPTTKPPQP